MGSSIAGTRRLNALANCTRLHSQESRLLAGLPQAFGKYRTSCLLTSCLLIEFVQHSISIQSSFNQHSIIIHSAFNHHSYFAPPTYLLVGKHFQQSMSTKGESITKNKVFQRLALDDARLSISAVTTITGTWTTWPSRHGPGARC